MSDFTYKCPTCKRENGVTVGCCAASMRAQLEAEKAEAEKRAYKAETRLRVRAVADKVITPLREAAREHGYALAVHGSLERDIDLIAVPWTDAASTAVVLAEAIRAKAEEVVGYAFLLPEESGEYFQAGCPGGKPHGRLCWSFHLGGGPYIDLSVMPTGERADKAVAERDEAKRQLNEVRAFVNPNFPDDTHAALMKELRAWEEHSDANVRNAERARVAEDRNTTLETALREAREWLSHATVFQFGGKYLPIRIEARAQRDGSQKWAVLQGGNCLRKDGSWELEMQPSSRTNEFLAATRWDTKEDARAALDTEGRGR